MSTSSHAPNVPREKPFSSLAVSEAVFTSSEPPRRRSNVARSVAARILHEPATCDSAMAMASRSMSPPCGSPLCRLAAFRGRGGPRPLPNAPSFDGSSHPPRPTVRSPVRSSQRACRVQQPSSARTAAARSGRAHAGVRSLVPAPRSAQVSAPWSPVRPPWCRSRKFP